MLELQEKISSKAGSKVVFVMFYALGTLSHVPQNFYITANDYWMYKFRNPESDAFNSSSTAGKTDLQAKFSSTYIVVATVSSVICITLTFALARRVSIQKRVIYSLSAMLGLLVITSIFVWINTDSWQTEFFCISLILGALLNGCGSCFMISVYHLAIKFPPVYLGTLLSGQSICGIVVSLIQISTLGMGTTSTVNAFIYFLIGILFIVIVEVLFLTMAFRADYFKKQLKSEQMDEYETDVDKKTLKTVTKKLMPVLITMVLTTGSSTMMHPGVTSLIESMGKGSGRWSDVFFVPFCTFFLFNTFDFFGRECSIRWNWIGGTYAMMAVGFCRLIFIPLILFCNIQPRKHWAVVFGEDYEYIVFIIFFAFSTGYLVNLCISQIQSVCTVEEKRIGLFVTMIFMIVGMVSCSFLSNVIISML